MAEKWGARLGALFGVLLLLLWAMGAGWPEPIVSSDIVQQRLNEALPPLREGVTLRQTFYPRHDGLSEIELLAARYPLDDNEGAIRLRLLDTQGQTLAEQRLDTATLSHNQVVTLRFPPQPRSAGQPYTLEASGEGAGAFSFWGYTLDTQQPGELSVSGAASPARELRFVTRYTLLPRPALLILGRTLAQNLPFLLLTLAFATMPGCLLLVRSRRARRWDSAAWWGVALALGLSLWPLLWFWLTLLGGHWARWGLWLTLVLGWGLYCGLQVADCRLQMLGEAASPNRFAERPISNIQYPISNTVLSLILLGGFAVRLLAVRDLAFPQWVDAVRHGLITAVMAADGRAITSYAPWLPIERFPYHFGFHTLPASLIRMTGWELAPLLLILGQLLNALVPLSVYAAAWLMTRRRAVGLIAAFLVAFPFLFPGYYATWGRFTQLTGMLVMPPLVALVWQLVRGGPRWRHAWWLVGLLASGLFLIHLRVFLYFLPFPLLVWAASRFRRARWVAAAGALTLLLVGVRAWELFPRASPLQRLSNTIEEYNSFPMGYVTAGWERYFVALAAVGALLGLGAWLRGRRWGALPMALAAWVGALFALLEGGRFGLPQTWLVNLNSMYITLFFPFALLIAIALDRLWGWSGLALRARAGRAIVLVQTVRHAALGAALTAALLFGIHNQIAILHPETTLARPQDLAGLEWVQDNLPPDARLAVSAWEWLNGAWAGTDGGAWLLPLTGRWGSTPPADYQYNPALAEEVQRFNEAAMAVEEWSDPAAARWLREQGYTHLFVGARGGFLDPAALARNPELSMLYGTDGVFVFEIRR